MNNFSNELNVYSKKFSGLDLVFDLRPKEFWVKIGVSKKRGRGLSFF